jgi:adenosylcobinamide-GDP ribazoletransferase
MNKYVNDFLLMLQFLTRIPINISLGCERENFRRGALFLPVVGFIIGGIQWIIYYLLQRIMPSSITAIFVVLTGAMVTGALHIDGLGDTCDGFYAFKGKDRIIEIMKDSRIGSFGAIAIVIDLLLKVAATSALFDYRMPEAVIAAAVAGRFSVVFMSFISKPAKSTGSGNLFIGNMNKAIVLGSAIITLLICSLLLGVKASAVIFVGTLILTFLISKYSRSKIDGTTGDILGANNELTEILAMILVIAMINL